MFLWSEFRTAKKKVIFITLLLLVFLFAAGCNKEGNVAITDKSDINENQISQFPLTIIDSANRSVTFQESPKRIVTVNPADMEIIYALGGEVVGRPQNSTGTTRPKEAEAAADIGFPLAINFERIAALKADLFIGHKRLNIKDVPTLEALNLNVVLTRGDSVDEIIGLIEMYGDVLDKKDEADALIHTIEKEITEILAEQQEKPARALILYGTPSETMAALPQSLAGNLFELVGVENICKDLPGLKAYPTYAQISLERILEADPDVIYFMSMGDDEKPFKQFQAEMSLVPVWNQLTAIKNNKLINLPYELFGTNPGPRIVESLQFLKNSLDSLEF